MNPYLPAPYVPVPMVPVDRNGVATAGLVVSLVAVAFALLPFLGVIAWVIWPVGVGLSGVGLYRAEQGVATNRGVAVAGLLTGALSALICTWWLAAATAPLWSWWWS